MTRRPARTVRSVSRPIAAATLTLAALLAALGPPRPAVALEVIGESANNGLFDPSIEEDPLTQTPWMVYSAVYGGAPSWGPHVETHLARSLDGGVTWNYEATLNSSEPGQIVLNDQVETGYWNREVPTLVHDPTDRAAPWKLMVHVIFRRDVDPFVEEATVPSHSWLELREAATPVSPFLLVARFGSGPLPPPPHPIDQAFNPLHPSLASTLVYSEPGLFAAGGLLYLSISALAPYPDGSFRPQVVLLRSFDHGASWSWVGPLLTPADAAALGYRDFGGSALVEDGGRVFLLASPGTPDFPRLGTAVFEVADLTTASLVEVAGVPNLLAQIPLTPTLPGGTFFGGQATYHSAAAAGGILMNQLELAALPELFTIRETGETPLPEPNPGVGIATGAAMLASLTRRRASRGRRPAADQRSPNDRA